MGLLACLLLLATGTAEEQIENLGSDDPWVRDEAERALLAMGRPVRGLLEEAARSPDAEVRDRARRILRDPAHWDIDEPLVTAMQALRTDAWQGAVSDLMAHDRGAVLQALETAKRRGGLLMKFRVSQLHEVLTQRPRGGLLYGIVVDRPECGPKGPKGVEIWVNAGDGEVTLEDMTGKYNINSSTMSTHIGWSSIRLCRGGHSVKTFVLRAGGSRVLKRDWLFSIRFSRGRSGSYYSAGVGTLSLTYKPDAKEGVWQGKITSNAVKIRVR